MAKTGAFLSVAEIARLKLWSIRALNRGKYVCVLFVYCLIVSFVFTTLHIRERLTLGDCNTQIFSCGLYILNTAMCYK